MVAFVLRLAGCLETTAGAALRLPLLGLTLVALAGLIRSQRRSGNPMFPPRLLRIRAVLCADILTACHGGVPVSFLTMVPLYQSIVLGDDVGRITWLLLAITLGSGLSGLTVGHVISRTGHLVTFPRVSLPLAALDQTCPVRAGTGHGDRGGACGRLAVCLSGRLCNHHPVHRPRVAYDVADAGADVTLSQGDHAWSSQSIRRAM